MFILILFLLFGCAHPPIGDSESNVSIYAAGRPSCDGGILFRHCPLFAAHGCWNSWNRIGAPSAKLDEKGEEVVYVRDDKPAIYVEEQKFFTENRSYTNLIYRIHFSEVPFSIVPFYLTAGKNVGLLVILTLDEKQNPLLVTTVSTCGCYVAIIPTTHLPGESYPEGWNLNESVHVYGEHLPPLLDFRNKKDPKVLVSLRPDVHRVMNLEVVEEAVLPGAAHRLIETSILPMEDLKKIPVNGKHTSFYYEEWPHRGLVKDSFKSWESISLSLISLDLFVGTDKIYGDSRTTGTRFYTSLKPWNREDSDMWNFGEFLKFFGWKL